MGRAEGVVAENFYLFISFFWNFILVFTSTVHVQSSYFSFVLFVLCSLNYFLHVVFSTQSASYIIRLKRKCICLICSIL